MKLKHVRHGAVKPQKAARSQKPINATAHKRHGTLSLTRLISLCSPNAAVAKYAWFAFVGLWSLSFGAMTTSVEMCSGAVEKYCNHRSWKGVMVY
jgi:hypothetical protein